MDSDGPRPCGRLAGTVCGLPRRGSGLRRRGSGLRRTTARLGTGRVVRGPPRVHRDPWRRGGRRRRSAGASAGPVSPGSGAASGLRLGSLGRPRAPGREPVAASGRGSLPATSASAPGCSSGASIGASGTSPPSRTSTSNHCGSPLSTYSTHSCGGPRSVKGYGLDGTSTEAAGVLGSTTSSCFDAHLQTGARTARTHPRTFAVPPPCCRLEGTAVTRPGRGSRRRARSPRWRPLGPSPAASPLSSGRAARRGGSTGSPAGCPARRAARS